MIRPRRRPSRRFSCDRGVELKPSDYRIVVTGELGRAYAASFEPMRLVPRDGMTEIVGWIEDDAQLTGLLDTVAALGLSLVSVSPVTPTEESAPPGSRRSIPRTDAGKAAHGTILRSPPGALRTWRPEVRSGRLTRRLRSRLGSPHGRIHPGDSTDAARDRRRHRAMIAAPRRGERSTAARSRSTRSTRSRPTRSAARRGAESDRPDLTRRPSDPGPPVRGRASSGRQGP